MKHRLNLALLTVWLVSTAGCVWSWLAYLDLPSFTLPFVPAFCSQLLLCRITKNHWLRALPVLPILFLLGIAGRYAIFGSGWDLLAALIFGLAAIAPTVGMGAGWLVWWLIQRRSQPKSTEEC